MVKRPFFRHMSHNIGRYNMLFNSKTRSCVQSSTHRRRLTKSDATVDGEYDPDLALAIQESIKQAEIDALKAKEKQNDALSKLESISKENRTRTMSNHSSMEMATETRHLKELVCVHMDLLQQQQDVISQKDKTIKTLKSENNALQCRLQRMERRMALLKQKEEMAASPHIITSPPPKPGTMSYTEPIVSPFEKHSHRKKSEVTAAVTKEETVEVPKATPVRTASTLIDDVKSKSRESHRKRKLASSVPESESSSKHLETNNLYYVSYYEPLADEVDVDTRPDILQAAQKQIDVEVPSFRIKTYTNLYVIEGTEDHEDETFARRHQKPEAEEKRRKRWDDQRVREEKMLEKLRERQELRHKYRKPEDPVESFFPCLDDITHIEVLDKIPVTAFGQPMPLTKQEPFSLPWTPKPTSSHRTRHK